MKLLNTALVFVALLLFACQADKKTEAKDEAIYSTYYVRYLETEQVLKAEATFRQGESVQTAQAKTYTNVFFNNKKMELRKLSNSKQRYVLDVPGSFPTGDLVFSFINDKGNREDQSFSLSPMNNLSVIGEVSKSNGTSISWEGEALSSDESVVCLFSNAANKTTSTIINGPSDGSQIIIPPQKMNALTFGTGEVYLVRKKKTGKNEIKRSRLAVMEYYTSTIQIEVVE